jgi:two-component system, cell cycle response regulator
MGGMETVCTILIVEDDPLGRYTLETLLRPLGHTIIAATTGIEALALVASTPPDLVLLDVMLPEMDGYAVCERLRATPGLAELPIILLTALDDRASRIRGLAAGADDFITKPFDPLELEARVRTIARLNRYRQLVITREQLDWVVERSTDGYVLTDTHDRVVFANPQARRYLGMGPQTAANPTFLQLARQIYNLEPAHCWDGWPNSDMSASRLLVLPQSPDIAGFWLHVDAIELAVGAEPLRMVQLRDVTTKVSAQRDMRSFHTMVTHKLRTPLIGMVGGVDLLDHLAHDGPHQIGEIARNVRQSVHRLQDAVNDVLRYTTAAQLGKDTFAIMRFDELLAEVATGLGLASVALRVAPDLHNRRVRLSRRAIEVVLWELLQNSHKFHPLRDPAIEVTLDRAGGAVALRVRDDGTPMTPRQLVRALQPYYQGEASFSGEAPGMGLGLATVATIIWGCGGTCQIRNRDDFTGIEVRLTIPFADPA